MNIFLNSNYLHNETGKICNVIEEKCILTVLDGINTLVFLTSEVSYLFSSNGTPNNITEPASSSWVLQDKNETFEWNNSLETIHFVWKNGTPVLLEDLEEGVPVNFDAIFRNGFGYQAILVWIGSKPKSSPVLSENEMMFVKEFVYLPVHCFSFKKGQLTVYVTVEDSVKEIAFTHHVANVDGKQVSSFEELENICQNDKPAVATICKFIKMDRHNYIYIFVCSGLYVGNKTCKSKTSMKSNFNCHSLYTSYHNQTVSAACNTATLHFDIDFHISNDRGKNLAFLLNSKYIVIERHEILNITENYDVPYLGGIFHVYHEYKGKDVYNFLVFKTFPNQETLKHCVKQSNDKPNTQQELICMCDMPKSNCNVIDNKLYTISNKDKNLKANECDLKSGSFRQNRILVDSDNHCNPSLKPSDSNAELTLQLSNSMSNSNIESLPQNVNRSVCLTNENLSFHINYENSPTNCATSEGQPNHNTEGLDPVFQSGRHSMGDLADSMPNTSKENTFNFDLKNEQCSMTIDSKMFEDSNKNDMSCANSDVNWHSEQLEVDKMVQIKSETYVNSLMQQNLHSVDIPSQSDVDLSNSYLGKENKDNLVLDCPQLPNSFLNEYYEKIKLSLENCLNQDELNNSIPNCDLPDFDNEFMSFLLEYVNILDSLTIEEFFSFMNSHKTTNTSLPCLRKIQGRVYYNEKLNKYYILGIFNGVILLLPLVDLFTFCYFEGKFVFPSSKIVFNDKTVCFDSVLINNQYIPLLIYDKDPDVGTTISSDHTSLYYNVIGIYKGVDSTNEVKFDIFMNNFSTSISGKPRFIEDSSKETSKGLDFLLNEYVLLHLSSLVTECYNEWDILFVVPLKNTSNEAINLTTVTKTMIERLIQQKITYYKIPMTNENVHCSGDSKKSFQIPKSEIETVDTSFTGGNFNSCEKYIFGTASNERESISQNANSVLFVNDDTMFHSTLKKENQFTMKEVEDIKKHDSSVKLGDGFLNLSMDCSGDSSGLKKLDGDSEPNNGIDILESWNTIGDGRDSGQTSPCTQLSPVGGCNPLSQFSSMTIPSSITQKDNSTSTFALLGDGIKTNSLPSSRDNSISSKIPPRHVLRRKFRLYGASLKPSSDILEKYISLKDVNITMLHIKEKIHPDQMHFFVRASLEYSIDFHSDKPKLVGNLLHDLIINKILSSKQFLKGSRPVLLIIKPLLLDIPLIFSNLAEILAPLLFDDTLSVKMLYTIVVNVPQNRGISSNIVDQKKDRLVYLQIFAKTLNVASKLLGISQVRRMWMESNLSWEKLLDGENVIEFVQQHGVEFTIVADGGIFTSEENIISTDNVSSQIEEKSSLAILFDGHKIRKQLIAIFKRGAPQEEIFNWIEANVGSYKESPAFAYALTQALVESQMETSDDGFHLVNGKNFQKNLEDKAHLIATYVFGNTELELACLIGIQHVCMENQHPAGLMEQSFIAFYGQAVLTKNSILIWVIIEDPPEEQLGKDICLNSVRNMLISMLKSYSEEVSTADESISSPVLSEVDDVAAQIPSNSNLLTDEDIFFNFMKTKKKKKNKKIKQPVVEVPKEVAQMDQVTAVTALHKLLRKTRGLLNKLTPENFWKLVSKIKMLQIKSHSDLEAVIKLIFEMAVKDQLYTSTYAKLCQALSTMAVQEEYSNSHNQGSKEEMDSAREVRFRRLIINKCQKEFEKTISKNESFMEITKQPESATAAEQLLELNSLIDYEETKLRKRSVCNIHFIGELYNLNMLTSSIMMEIIEGLLKKKDDASLECLGQLLMTIGKNLETSPSSAQVKEDFNCRFQDLQNIIEDKNSTSSRVRFFLMDVIDLRKNNWVPQREVVKFKTKSEIQANMKKEELSKQQLQFNLMTSNPPRNGNNKAEECGCNMVETTNNRRIPLDGKRLQMTPFRHDNDVELRAGFTNWGRGSAGGSGELKLKNGKAKPNYIFTILGKKQTGICEPMLDLGGVKYQCQNFFCSNSILQHLTEKDDAISPMKTFAQPDGPTTSREVPYRLLPIKFKNYNASLKISKSIVEEYTSIKDVKKAMLCIEEKFHPRQVAWFVHATLEYATDRDSEKRSLVGRLFNDLMMNKKLTLTQFLKGSNSVIEMIEDLRLDIPQVCENLGEILAPLLLDGAINIKDLLKIVEPAASKKIDVWGVPTPTAGDNLDVQIFANTLYSASILLGPSRVQNMWLESKLTWEKLLDRANVQEFLEKHASLSSINLFSTL